MRRTRRPCQDPSVPAVPERRAASPRCRRRVRSIAVLDRTKEPGATGEPLLLDVITTVHEAMDSDDPPFASAPHVIGGRYGLSSKEFRPAHVKAVFDELAGFDTGGRRPKRRFTVGIHDDVTHLSLDADETFRYPRPAGEVQAMFFGLGADGTVGANKASVKIIGEHTDGFAQGYFVYDSKKSGSVTVSHLRFGPEPIRSTYLIEDADFVACHQFGLLEKLPVLDRAKPGATLLLNSPYRADEVWDQLPSEVQAEIIDKRLAVWTIDAHQLAKEHQLGARINTVMQPCFFALAGVIPADEAIAHIKASVEQHLRSPRQRDRGAQLRRDRRRPRTARPGGCALDGDVPAHAAGGPARGRARLRHACDGPADGRRGGPAAGLGVARRRHVPDRYRPLREAGDRPGDPDLGPRHLHRLRQVRDRLPARHDPDEGVPAGRVGRGAAVVQVQGVPLQGHLRVPDDDPGRSRRLHRLRRLRRRLPGQVEDRGPPQVDQHGAGTGAPRRRTAGVGLLPVDPRAGPRAAAARLGEGLAGAAAAVRVLRRVCGLRRDAVHQAGNPTVRRPHGGGQRDRLLVDLRRQPPDDAMDGQRRGPWPGVEQLAVRGQRRVRARAPARPGGPDRARPPAP